MNVSAWAIRNPVPSILLFVVLTFLGIDSFRSLGIQNFPDIELPTIIVTARYEGATPSQLETEVARKIENAVATLGGIQHIVTTLTDGSAVIRVQFEIDKDSEVALNEVRNAIDIIRSDLPADMRNPEVSKVTTSGSPILTFAVQSKHLDEEALSWFVDNEVSKKLLSVPGVGKVSRIGGVTRQVNVDLDPSRMVALGITPNQISTLLKSVEKDFSGGRGDIGKSIQSIRTLGAVPTAQQVGDIEIPITGGRYVRLGDIAKVTDGIETRSTITRLDRKTVVSFQITRTKGASEVAVAKEVRKAVAKIQKAHPNLNITEAFNTVNSVQDNYNGSMELLFEGAILAILVVFLFLRDWRATLVSATALPLAIIPTFAAMYFMNFSLNTLTLLAMALVVGILVDDAIVEVENIVRHLRMGKKPIVAATEAADEIGLAVIATTFTLVAVFLPTAFMGGIPGKFFRQFGITAAVAVFASLVVARLLTPMMAAYFLKAHAIQSEDSASMKTYLKVTSWCQNHRKTTVIAAILFFVGSLALIPLLPTGFLPAADTGLTRINIQLQPGSRLEDTAAIADQARRITSKLPEVTSVFSSIGMASGAGGPVSSGGYPDVRKATLTVTLVSRHDRAPQKVIEAEIRKRLSVLPGVRWSVGAGQAGEVLKIVLAGEDAGALEVASQKATAELRSLPGIGNVTSGASLQRPEIHIIPDYAKAADLGVTAGSIASLIRVATSGDFNAQLPKLNLPQRQVPIRVRLSPELRYHLDAIKALRVPTNQGSVPLSSIAKVQMGSGPAQINRFDRERNVTIDVQLGGSELGEVLKEANKLPALQSLPPGIHRLNSGDVERMKELFGSFGTAMMIGILCIYVVLVLLFHDFLQPVTILAALPLSVGGAFIALLATHHSFSMPAVIGLLMLMGIVTKNSILLVEYAVKARRNLGMSRHDAILDACRKRARPILMTTIAMVAGMIPIALGLGAEPSFRSPMAIAVIGGLLTSTLLSLLVIPVVFTYVDDLLNLLQRGIRRFTANEKTV